MLCPNLLRSHISHSTYGTTTKRGYERCPLFFKIVHTSQTKDVNGIGIDCANDNSHTAETNEVNNNGSGFEPDDGGFEPDDGGFEPDDGGFEPATGGEAASGVVVTNERLFHSVDDFLAYMKSFTKEVSLREYQDASVHHWEVCMHNG